MTCASCEYGGLGGHILLHNLLPKGCAAPPPYPKANSNLIVFAHGELEPSVEHGPERVGTA